MHAPESHRAAPLATVSDATACNVLVLAVSPLPDDHISLRAIFRHSKWQLHSAATLEEARAFLYANPVGVVLSECTLAEGKTWKDLLRAVEVLRHPPPLIVTSRLADECLWAEVLNLGGYDLLIKPFDPTEVFRVVSLAWLSWKSRIEKSRPARERTHKAGNAAVWKAGAG
ncbi:MAG: response regulator [Bryobacterales bacterium]|nr:response regulator [Bryobacteraceae bacterium]MDW8354867.1 response regulator [Bryobacterales bacterium]